MTSRQIKGNINFNKLDENLLFLLGHVFEQAFLIDKITSQEIGIFTFDSDPTCGLIGTNNDWCVIGGDILIVKTFFDNTLRTLPLHSINALKKIDDYKVQILIDPWSEKASIWQLEIDINNPAKPINLFKIKDLPDYKDKPYSENILW